MRDRLGDLLDLVFALIDIFESSSDALERLGAKLNREDAEREASERGMFVARFHDIRKFLEWDRIENRVPLSR